jgi:hypothetical protein
VTGRTVYRFTMSISPYQYFLDRLHEVLECIDGRSRRHLPWRGLMIGKITSWFTVETAASTRRGTGQ